VIIYDLTGRVIRNLENTELSDGQHTINWDGTGENGETVSTGLYFCRIQVGVIIETTGLCLLK
jgi:flagellar hook assembly protein FlgD